MQGPDEQVGGQCARKGVERVHATEAPVDRQHRRSGRHERRGGARSGPRESAAQIPADRDRREREDDGEPPERERRRIDGERDVGQEKMQRRPAPLPPDCLEHLAEWTRCDQPGYGLVLEERLPAHVLDDPKQQDGHSCTDRERPQEPRNGKLSESRHGPSPLALRGAGDPAPLGGLGHRGLACHGDEDPGGVDLLRELPDLWRTGLPLILELVARAHVADRRLHARSLDVDGWWTIATPSDGGPRRCARPHPRPCQGF